MAQDMHDTFDYDVDEDKDHHELVLTKCRTYCEPRKKHRVCNQSEDEPTEQWVTDLGSKAAKCEFQAHESSVIRDKIVFGVHDTRFKERLLREADLTLACALDVCRAAETNNHKLDTMGRHTHTQIHAMHTQKYVSHRGKTSDRATSHQTGSNDKRESVCQYCGQSHAPRHWGEWQGV